MTSWTRTILTPIAIIAVICALGTSVVQVLHKPIHTREMILAAIVVLAAAEFALVPVWFVRNKPADVAAPGALASTVVHMGVAAAVGLTVQQLAHPPIAFLYWLCAFYGSTLVGLCRVLTRVVKSASVPVTRQAFSGK